MYELHTRHALYCLPHVRRRSVDGVAHTAANGRGDALGLGRSFFLRSESCFETEQLRLLREIIGVSRSSVNKRGAVRRAAPTRTRMRDRCANPRTTSHRGRKHTADIATGFGGAGRQTRIIRRTRTDDNRSWCNGESASRSPNSSRRHDRARRDDQSGGRTVCEGRNASARPLYDMP